MKKEIVQAAADVLRDGDWCTMYRGLDVDGKSVGGSSDEAEQRCVLGALDRAFALHPSMPEVWYDAYQDNVPEWNEIVVDLCDMLGLHDKDYLPTSRLVIWNNHQVSGKEEVIAALEDLAESYD